MSLFKKKYREPKRERISFKEKLNHFQSLLNANDEALKLMSSISELLVSGRPFSRGQTYQTFLGIVKNTEEVVKHLSIMCDGKYKSLAKQVAFIEDQCSKILAPRIYCPGGWDCPELNCNVCEKTKNDSPDRPYSYKIEDITTENTREVGGKMSRLCEIHNKLNIPIPSGFCLTSRCFEDFLSKGDLYLQIDEALSSINFDDNAQVQQASQVIQALIVSAPIPNHIEKEIFDNYEHLAKKKGNVLLSVRSSAVGEDDVHYSFAGLHYTALNVSKSNLIDACFEVLISKYLPQSLVYRYVKGLRDVDMPMSIGCMQMINAEAGGVLFTRDPMNVRKGIIIQAVRGLGTKVVDGSVKPQEFIVERNGTGKILEFKKGNQEFRTVPMTTDGLHEDKIPDDIINEPCLKEDKIKKLTEYALEIEKHFGSPQDIEWAIDNNNEICILQTRPLAISNSPTADIAKIETKGSDSEYPILIDGGECASPGIGSGQVFFPKRFKDLINFPTGGILVVKKVSPELTRVLHKASGLVADIGNTTGHLSIIARELGIPVLVNTHDSTTHLSNGMTITIDARDEKVYLGKVTELTERNNSSSTTKNTFMKSPMYRIWQKLSKLIIPLNLTEPDSSEFAPENCETLHDVTRFAHEFAMREMFSLYESAHIEDKFSYPLKFSVPLDIQVIDLGNGLKEIKGKHSITPDDVISEPFRYLIKGMTTPGIRWAGPLPIDFRGLTNLLMTNIVDSNRSNRDLGSKSYAFISDSYLNFFSRLGYHFSRLDAYISDEINSNYINFNFRGGAAEPIRKMRRAKIIAKILENLNFSVNHVTDNVFATIRKIPSPSILNLLSEIGRLMGAVRNVDATLISDDYINKFVEAFLSGDPAPALRITEEKEN
jgi:pyruvate,water dikinase